MREALLKYAKKMHSLAEEEAKATDEFSTALDLFEAQNPEAGACDADPLRQIWRGKAFNKITDITDIVTTNEMETRNPEN